MFSKEIRNSVRYEKYFPLPSVIFRWKIFFVDNLPHSKETLPVFISNKKIIVRQIGSTNV